MTSEQPWPKTVYGSAASGGHNHFAQTPINDCTMKPWSVFPWSGLRAVPGAWIDSSPKV
jgi:hypothetical protein